MAAMADVTAAVLAAVGTIGSLTADGVSNGGVAPNSLSPLAGRVEPHCYVALAAGTGGGAPVMASLTASIVHITGCEAQDLPPGRPSILAAVCMVLGRMAAARMIQGWVPSLNRSEVVTLSAAQIALEPHANHMAAIVDAINLMAPVAARFVPILSYNAAMVSEYGHCHVPDAGKRLTATTKRLSPVWAMLDEDATLETAVFHDMYHMTGGNIMSEACRGQPYVIACGLLGYDNLRKRLPITPPDTAPAIDYQALYDTASTLCPAGPPLPASFAPPASIAVAIADAHAAAAGAPLVAAVDRVRAIATALVPSCLYLAGYILGRLRAIHDEDTMTIRIAVRTHRVTILGANFIDRERGSGAGLAMFSAGVTHGEIAATNQDAADHRAALLAICDAGVAAAAAL